MSIGHEAMSDTPVKFMDANSYSLILYFVITSITHECMKQTYLLVHKHEIEEKKERKLYTDIWTNTI